MLRTVSLAASISILLAHAPLAAQELAAEAAPADEGGAVDLVEVPAPAAQPAPAPAAAQPAPAAAPAAVPVQSLVPIVVQTTAPELQLTLHQAPHGPISRGSWQAICAAPCQTSLVPAEYRLGMSLGARRVTEMGLLTIDQPGTLMLSYQRRKGLRTLGWVLLAVGLGVGIPLVLGGSVVNALDGDATRYIIGGAVAAGLGLGGGIALGVQRDRPNIEWIPGGVAF